MWCEARGRTSTACSRRVPQRRDRDTPRSEIRHALGCCVVARSMGCVGPGGALNSRLIEERHSNATSMPKTPLSDSLQQLLGKGVDAIDTPSLVVDIDAMMRNLSRMAEFAKKHDIRWRPHAKMHKSSELAKLQVKAGAIGVCVQKTSEAE